MRKFSDTFWRNAIATRALVPPRDGYPSRSDRIMACIGWIITALGFGAFAVAFLVDR